MTPLTFSLSPRGRRLVAIMFMIVASAPLIIAMIRTIGQPYFPAGDQAVIELRVRDVGRHTPLLGPYSRYGWNHPGPMIYAVLAVPYRLLGAHSTSVLAASAIINLVSIGGIGVIAWRRGRSVLVAITALGVVLFMANHGADYLQNPWNPLLTLLPVALFLFLAWTTVEGDRWAAPLTLLVGSFLVQSHVGYALYVGVVSAWCVLHAVRERRRHGHAGAGWRAPLVACAAVFVVGWLPVLIDQIWGTHNFGAILQYFTTGDRTPVGFGEALRYMAREFGGGPPHLGGNAPWIGGQELTDPSTGSVIKTSVTTLIVPAVWFLGAAFVAWRTRALGALRLQGLVTIALGSVYISLARITDTVYNYLIRWTWVVAMVMWISIFWSLWSAFTHSSLPERFPRPVNLARHVGPVVVAVILVWWTWGTLQRDIAVPEAWAQSTLAALSEKTTAAVPGSGLIRVKGEGGFANSVTDGIALQLEKSGHPVQVEASEAFKFGDHRTAPADRPVTTVWVVYADAIDEYEARPDLQEVARWDPLSPSERDQYRRDTRVLLEEFAAIERPDLERALATGDSIYIARNLTGVDQELLTRYEKFRDRGAPVAVFVGPAVD